MSDQFDGELCGMCYREGVEAPALHKVGEEASRGSDLDRRHNLSQYVCCEHFKAIMGRASDMWACGHNHIIVQEAGAGTPAGASGSDDPMWDRAISLLEAVKQAGHGRPKIAVVAACFREIAREAEARGYAEGIKPLVTDEQMDARFASSGASSTGAEAPVSTGGRE